MEYAAQGRNEVDVVVLVTVLRHLGKENYEEHCHNHKSYDKIRTDEHRQVVILYCLKLAVGEGSTRGCVKWIELRLDEVHSHIHAKQRSHRIE